MIVDLKAKGGYGVRQVDHRSISSLTLKNVKYVLKTSKNKNLEWKEDKPYEAKRTWNPT